jgi:hypothetical protein
MKRLHVKFIKWLSNKFGYKITMLKASNGTIVIEGDSDLLKYVDASGYFFNKEPLRRNRPSKAPQNAKEMFLSEPKPDVSSISPIKKLSKDQLKEIGLV